MNETFVAPWHACGPIFVNHAEQELEDLSNRKSSLTLHHINVTFRYYFLKLKLHLLFLF